MQIESLSSKLIRQKNSTWFVKHGAVWFFLLALVYLHVFSMQPLPLHGDELFFLNKAELFHDHVYDFTSDSFKLFRFYRILGRPLNFLAYVIAGKYPVILTAVLTFSVCFFLYAYSRILSSFISHHNSHVPDLMSFITLTVPFSYYLVLLRVVFHEIVTMGLILFCLWLVKKYPSARKQTLWAFGIAITYTISLYVYESSLLMPFFFVTLLLLFADRHDISIRSISILAFFLILSFFLYIYLQFFYLANQPKLSDSMASYAPYSIGLNYGEQFLRILLYGIYHLKWSFLTILRMSAVFTILDYIVMLVALTSSSYFFWRLLSYEDTYVPREKAGSVIIAGILFFCASFGLWVYYWIFKKAIVFPPFYTVLLPATGVSFALVGILSTFADIIRRNRELRVVITLVFSCLLVTNGVLVLSSRFAISNTAREIVQYAKTLNKQFGSSAKSNRNLILLDLPTKSFYDRRKLRYESLLTYCLQKGNIQWGNIEMISNAISLDGSGALIALPQGKILLPAETLIVRYKEKGLFQKVSPEEIRSLAFSHNKSKDPFQVTLFNYKLFYSVTRANIVLEKIL